MRDIESQSDPSGVAEFRLRSRKPLNLNFFCHALAGEDLAKEQALLDRIAPYYSQRFSKAIMMARP